MTRFKPICELCGRGTLCDICRGQKSNGRTTNQDVHRLLIHTVTGTPSQVVREWERLARQDKSPS